MKKQPITKKKTDFTKKILENRLAKLNELESDVQNINNNNQTAFYLNQDKVELEQLQTELKESKQENQKLKELLNALRNQLQESQDQNKYISNVLRKQNESSSYSLKSNYELNLQLNLKEEELREERQLRNQLKQQKDKLEKDFKQISDELQQKIEEQRKQEVLSRGQGLQIQNVKDLSEDLEKQQVQNKKLDDIITDLSARLDEQVKHQSKYMHLEKQRIEEQQQKLREMSNKIEDLKKQMNDKDEQIHDKDQFIKNQSEQKTLDKKTIENLQKKTDIYQKLITKLQKAETKVEINPEFDDTFFKVLGRTKIYSDQQELQQFIKQGMTKEGSEELQRQYDLEKEILELKEDKGKLALQIEQIQSLHQTKLAINMQQMKLYQAQVNQLQLELSTYEQRNKQISQLVDKKVTNEIDRVYEGSTTGFSDLEDDIDEDIDSNYLDLYIGQAVINSKNLYDCSEGKIRQDHFQDDQKFKTFISIDFYNHKTIYSDLASSYKPYYNFQVGFRIKVNNKLIDYLMSQYIQIEVFEGISKKPIKLGSCQIKLNELIQTNDQKNNVSVIMKNQIQVFKNISEQKQSQICQMNYKIRFRNQIVEQIRNYLQTTKEIEQEEQVEEKELLLMIEKGNNFPKGTNPFVYYQMPFDEEDFSTGIKINEQNPIWNYKQQHFVKLSNKFDDFMKKGKIQFVVFNNQTETNEREEGLIEEQFTEDVIGYANMDIQELQYQDEITKEIPVYPERSTQELGRITVCISWLSQLQIQKFTDDTIITKAQLEQMTAKIASKLKDMHYSLNNSYQLFDVNQSKHVTYKEFQRTIFYTLNIKHWFKISELQWFYNKLTKPFDQQAFINLFQPYLEEEEYNIKHTTNQNLLGKHQQEMQMQKVNGLREKVFCILVSKLTIEKDIKKIFESVSIKNYMVRRNDLMLYLQTNGIQASDKDLLLNLILSFDPLNTGFINIKSFITDIIGHRIDVQDQFQQSMQFGMSKELLDFINKNDINFNQLQQRLIEFILENRDEIKESFVQNSLKENKNFIEEASFKEIMRVHSSGFNVHEYYVVINGICQKNASNQIEWKKLFDMTEVSLEESELKSEVNKICKDILNQTKKYKEQFKIISEVFDKNSQNGQATLNQLQTLMMQLKVNLTYQQLNYFLQYFKCITLNKQLFLKQLQQNE